MWKIEMLEKDEWVQKDEGMGEQKGVKVDSNAIIRLEKPKLRRL